MSLQDALDKLQNETDPLKYLLSASMDNTQSMYQLQGQTAQNSDTVAQISYANVSAGNQLLDADVAGMSGLSSNSLTKAQIKFQTDSTEINNNNNNFSNVTQTEMTAVTDLTQQEQQALGSASAILNNFSGYTSLLQGWS